MKKLFIPFVCFFLITSCSKNNDTEQQQNTITGRYNLTAMSKSGVNITVSPCALLYSKYEFISSSQMIAADGDLNGNICMNDQGTHYYTLINNVFTQSSSDGGFTAKYNVNTLNNTTFIITQFYVKEVFNGVILNEETIPVAERIKYTYTKTN